VAGRQGDDAVLLTTRVLSAFIIPFLLVAFVVLYGWPGETERLFAWTIRPSMTPMVLGAVYIGGAYFFARAFRASRWHTVKVGFIPVTTFASLLGVTTVVHWDRFNHDHLAFWLWAGLYFTTPLLVLGAFLLNQRREGPADDEARLSTAARIVVGGTGAASLGLGLFLFLAPEAAIDVWPWMLTPLTSRVMGAVFSLGIAGLVILSDPRWTTARIMLQTEQVMLLLILVAAARASDQMEGGRPLTWLLLAGLAGVLVTSTLFSLAMDRRVAVGPGLSSPRRRSPSRPGPGGRGSSGRP
jgi:hypothetical protein